MIKRINLKYCALMCLLTVAVCFNSFPQRGEYSAKLRSSDDRLSTVQLIDSAYATIDIDYQKAFDFVERALEKSISNHNQLNELKCYHILGRINFSLDQINLAIDYYYKAVNLYEYRDEDLIHQIYYDLAGALEKAENYTESLKYYQLYLTYCERQQRTDDIVSTKQDIARLFVSKGDYKSALIEYNQILAIEEQRQNQAGIVNANTLIGEVYLQQNDNRNAISNYKKAVDIADESNDPELRTKSRKELSKAYRKNRQYDEELEVRQQSLDINQERPEYESMAEDNLEIGKIYIEQNKPDEAIKYIQQSIELSDKSDNYEKKGLALKTLSEAYEEKGEYDKALVAYTDYAKSIDSFYNQRETELKKNLEIVASVSRKLQQIELLEREIAITKQSLELMRRENRIGEKELRNQRLITYSLILAILILATASFFVYRGSLQKRKANTLLALKSLRSQMNPHFIFNSLNSVNNYISRNEARMANKYLSDFASLMRSVMENSKHDFVPVSTELTTIELYLKLEHSRFEEKFDYEFVVDDGIRNSEYVIPPMLIQPYIENAIWHGLRYKEEKGFLSVSILKKKNCIAAVVSDDGIGRERSQALKTEHQKKNSSTGLKNTRSRIEIINTIYKTNLSVTVEDLNKEDHTGTRVEINIPYSLVEQNLETE